MIIFVQAYKFNQLPQQSQESLQDCGVGDCNQNPRSHPFRGCSAEGSMQYKISLSLPGKGDFFPI